MTATPTATFDTEALRRAEEGADAEGLLALIADDAVIESIDSEHPPTLPDGVSVARLAAWTALIRLSESMRPSGRCVRPRPTVVTYDGFQKNDRLLNGAALDTSTRAPTSDSLMSFYSE